MPLKLAQILLQKKQKDSAGLRNAQKNGTMADYLREDLLANGINPDSLDYGGNMDLNVGSAMSITKNLNKGLTDESKPRQQIDMAIGTAQGVYAPKCPSCSKNVHKMEEVLFLEQEWHKECFVCGLGGEIGCKAMMKKGEYSTHNKIAYCNACFARNFQLGAARGAILTAAERSDVEKNHL